MNRQFLRTFLLLGFATAANAHFVFIVPQPGGSAAQVFISEELKPDSDVDAGLVSGAKLSLRDAKGRETPLVLVKGQRSFETALAGDGLRLIHGVADLGLMQQGQTKPYLLLYYPKTILGNAFDPKTMVAGDTPVELVPVGSRGALRLKLLVHGKPQAKSEVTVILPDGTQKKLTTDEAGLTDVLTQSGRYGAWARSWEQIGGARDGKTYTETRNYATLVFDTPTEAAAALYPALPQATSSFGAVVSDGWLYVYGGHIARTHSYSTEAVSGQFARLKLAGGTEWEQLPAGEGLQGMNLAAHQGKIYLIGGMRPRNKPGEKEDIWSVADCARFDPATMKWEALPPLPQPRSSHDVVVVGDTLIVTGGWTLKGSERTEWRDNLEMLDLTAATPAWKSVPQPFKRRAFIASSMAGKMYVLGGFDEHSKIIRDVSIYDPAAGSWTQGAPLPGDATDGFAPAACVHAGKLYVSVADGGLYRLDESRRTWEKEGAATPRLAHRIASWDKNVLVIGGADNGRNLNLIEAVPAGE